MPRNVTNQRTKGLMFGIALSAKLAIVAAIGLLAAAYKFLAIYFAQTEGITTYEGIISALGAGSMGAGFLWLVTMLASGKLQNIDTAKQTAAITELATQAHHREADALRREDHLVAHILATRKDDTKP